MELGRLEIPAELSAVLKTSEGRRHVMAENITEALPPEVTAQDELALPPDIDRFPFSSFISENFQKPTLPTLGQPLTSPLTHLDRVSLQLALDVNKVMLRLLGDLSLQSWQEQTLGTYLAHQGQCHPALRNEIFCQLVTQLWHNPDEQQSHRGWALMAILLSAFTPTTTLQKPLLKFVSDHAPKGIAAVCQHKLLGALQQSQSVVNSVRAYPPTQLEWISGWRCGRMVLDVFTFSEERYSAEVKSWTTGEEFAGWILQTRGIEQPIRGWSVSLISGDSWQDLAGCDFVLDLIGQTEYLGDPSAPDSYPITPHNGTSEDIPSPPGIQAPLLTPAPPLGPAPSLPQRSYPRQPQSSKSLDGFLDNLFDPVLSPGSRQGLEQTRALNSRMKGGGGIGTQQGGYSLMYPGMMQMPNYQPAMGAMMPAPVPLMPAIPSMPSVPSMGGVPAMPGMMMPSQSQPVVPTLSAEELAAQQQSFINQQAMILAQQMTTQAMTLSLEQQAQIQRLSQASIYAPQLTPSTPKPKKSPAVVSKSSPVLKAEPQRSLEPAEIPEVEEEKLRQPNTFQEKRDYFQKIGQESIWLKKVKPLAKVPIPQREIEQGEEEEEEEEEEEIKAPSPPPVVKKPLNKKEGGDKTKNEDGAGAKARDEVKTNISPQAKSQKESKERPPGAVVRSSKPAHKLEEPSREIRNIIKMYQSRPAPAPEPIQPARKPQKSFIKKNDPKDEALAKLGLSGNCLPPPASALGPKRDSPPPVPSRPKSPISFGSSSSIKEKQRPLKDLFAPVQDMTSIPESPSSPPPPPPPPPPSLPPESPAPPTSDPVLSMKDEHISTKLLPPSSSVCFAYASATWRLFLQKEVFYPRENFNHPYCLRLLCEQILRDTFTESCIRISPDERNKMKAMLADLQVGMNASSITEDSIKKRIVVAARDNWDNYFSRIFRVSGESGSDVQLLAVSHRGLRLLKVVNNATFFTDHLKTLCSYSFAEVLEVKAEGHGILQFSLRNEKLILRTTQAQTIKSMVELFLNELKKDSSYVIALQSYVTDDRSLLSFRCGDIIKLLPMASLEPGWQFGSIGGRSGLFPSNTVKVAAVPDYFTFPKEQKDGWQRSLPRGETRLSPQHWATECEHTHTQAPSESSVVTSSVFLDVSSTLSTTTSTYAMWEYAQKYFRPIKTSEGQMVSKHHARSLVQHTKTPIQKSLTNLTSEELNKLAVQNFRAVMQFMGDQPKKKDDLDIPFEMLQLCRENNLKDEIYCQLIKQVTENPQQEHCIRGWYLLNLLTGYFLPSSTLMPYVIKYLQDAALNQELAQTCEEHLQHTVKYGGRQHLPTIGEMKAFLKGQTIRPLLLHLPGGMAYKTIIQTFTVVAEVLEEVCRQMGIREPLEMQEFAIFLIKGKGVLVRPLHRNEYLNNVMRETDVELHSRRLTWDTPLHYENEVYVSTHYGQVHRDYLQGKLLISTQPQVEALLAPLVALQHLSREISYLPSEQDLLRYVPQPLQLQVNLQILGNLVKSQLMALKRYSRREVHISFIEAMKHLPLFGYTVYSVLRVSEPIIITPCLLGLNHQHLILVDPTSQEQCYSIPLKAIQKLRQLGPLDDTAGLELYYGSSASPKTIWFELPQAQELRHILVFLMEYSTST
uniref:Myosin XVB isoform X1 n=1 Tax=Phascolarctos cinereus TaxID=38626 RepID=A0A6P5LPK9_PHACI|nr:myosin XVB isoform X1 [Phascolarctos cinereus]XP_020858353.1 myosin XVB isoform X1 [Phascolarctos cinereus]XP_020858354.1 myosin XVB isoform X1 [Phascolarctos cinereus]